MTSALEARDICLDLPGAPARVLQDVNVRVDRGELVVLIGASGSGKTSLLRCLNALQQPTSGSVLLAGADVAVLAPVTLRRRVGMIPQVPFMFAGTVVENLRLAARYAGIAPVTDDLLGAALADSGLAATLLDRVAGELSIGQQQRVAIARVLVARPEFLLCDEPTSALDEVARLKLEETLIELRTRGVGLLFVTHDLDQAERLGDRMLTIQHGVMTQTGGDR